jgi:hypothetical protein
MDYFIDWDIEDNKSPVINQESRFSHGPSSLHPKALAEAVRDLRAQKEAAALEERRAPSAATPSRTGGATCSCCWVRDGPGTTKKHEKTWGK